MQTIIVYGKKEDSAISDTLQKILDFYGKYYIFNSGTAIHSKFQDNVEQEFLIIDTDVMPITQIGMKDIMIFKNEIPDLLNITLPKMFCAVVESTNTNAISLLNNSKIEVVTCGLSNKDTLTFSSAIEDRIVISLQRSLKNVFEKIIEPNEIPMNLPDDIDRYAILSAVVTLILSGINFENQVIKV